jgi:hypothetical protein
MISRKEMKMPSTADMLAAIEEALAKGTQGPFAWREEIIADVGGENIRCGYWFLYGGDKLILSDGSACGEYCQDIDPQGQDARLLCALLNAAPGIVAAAKAFIDDQEREIRDLGHTFDDTETSIEAVDALIWPLHAALVATGAVEAGDD